MVFGPAIWTGDVLYGYELYGLWLQLIAFFGLLFCVIIVCWTWCAFDQIHSLPLRYGDAQGRVEHVG